MKRKGKVENKGRWGGRVDGTERNARKKKKAKRKQKKGEEKK